MEPQKNYVGIDVAKAGMSTRTKGGRSRMTAPTTGIPPKDPGHRGTLRRLWKPWRSTMPVARVNPRQVRDFARATGKLAKTDTWTRHGPLLASGPASGAPSTGLRDAVAPLPGRSQTPADYYAGRTA